MAIHLTYLYQQMHHTQKRILKLKGRGHNQSMSNFGLYIQKTCIFKKSALVVAFFAVLLLREKQKKPFVSTKEPFCFSNVFCICYFLKTKRNFSKKKIQRNVFLSICSSHAKNQENLSKNKKQPKIQHRLVMLPALHL